MKLIFQAESADTLEALLKERRNKKKGRPKKEPNFDLINKIKEEGVRTYCDRILAEYKEELEQRIAELRKAAKELDEREQKQMWTEEVARAQKALGRASLSRQGAKS